jgi:hypothetical protein
MVVAVYARVSTSDQSCEMQLHELRQYVVRQGWEVFAEYVDTGFSGAQTSRPELDRLMQDARLRRFEAVLVWKLDRWGRSVAHCVRTIQHLVALRIPFLSPTRLSTPGSKAQSRGFFCTYSRHSPKWSTKSSANASGLAFGPPKPRESRSDVRRGSFAETRRAVCAPRA